MKRLFVLLILTAALLSSPGLAMAACTTHTVWGPKGLPILCRTCCLYGHCTTTCF